MANKNKLYFSHDAGARRDIKMLKVRAKYGCEGVGIWWMLIETLRESENYQYHFETDDDLHALAYDFGCRPDMIQQFIEDCISWQLLTKQGNNIFSESLMRRMELKDEISKKRSNAVQVRYKSNTNEVQNDYKSNTNESQRIKYKDKVVNSCFVPQQEQLQETPAGEESLSSLDPLVAAGQEIEIDYSVRDNAYCRSTYLRLFNRLPRGVEISWWERLRREEYTNEQIAEGLKLASDQKGDDVKFAYLKKVVTNRRDASLASLEAHHSPNGLQGYDYVDEFGNYSRTVIL